MKEVVIIAGPNGSGKSTLAFQLGLSVNFINADMCEKKLFSHIEDKETRERYVAVAVAQEIKRYLGCGESFAFETVFSSDKIPQFLRKAKSIGYTITTHFVATENSAINVARVAKRVSEGGHDVPKQRIIDRYAKSLAVLPELLDFSDKAILYDNSHETMRAFLAKENGQIKVIGNVPHWAEKLISASN